MIINNKVKWKKSWRKQNELPLATQKHNIYVIHLKFSFEKLYILNSSFTGYKVIRISKYLQLMS